MVLQGRPTRSSAYLALHHGGAGREELIDAIWPGQDPQAALRRLYRGTQSSRPGMGPRRRALPARPDQDPHRPRQARPAAHMPVRGRAAITRSRARAVAAPPLTGCDYLWADGDIHRLHSVLLKLRDRLSQLRLEDGDARGVLRHRRLRGYTAFGQVMTASLATASL